MDLFKKRPMKTMRQELKERAVRLYRQGVSTAVIAQRLGMSVKTIRRYVNEAEADHGER